MALNLMYITNNPEVAQIAENAGVDRIFVDMEYIGKQDRQGGMDTVQSFHTVEDIKRIKKVVQKAQIMVRINPVHDAGTDCTSTEEEIEQVIAAGADIIMLPYFKTLDEVRCFLKCVNKRVKTILLIETPEAVENLEQIYQIKDIDEVYVGLNDLSLGYHRKFMFELLADGTVERIVSEAKSRGIPFGFGGIARVGQGTLPAENIIREHYRLGSECVILSRSFCNTSEITDLKEIEKIFKLGIKEIREVEQECQKHTEFFLDNQRVVKQKVNQIVS